MNQSDIKSEVKLEVIKEKEIRKLFLPGEMGAILEWEVKNQDGKVTSSGKKKSESFVRQFIDLFWVMALHLNVNFPAQARDTGNTLRNLGSGLYMMGAIAGVGNVDYGIIAGLDNTAPTISDYKLGTPCGHGAGLNQFQYGASAMGLPTSDATTSQLTITRNLANASGNPITVNEIGLYCYFVDTGNTGRYFMIIRDVIAGGIAVPNGDTLTVNYRALCTI